MAHEKLNETIYLALVKMLCMRLFFLIVIITIAWNSFASDLKIDGIEWSRNGREHYKVKFTVS